MDSDLSQNIILCPIIDHLCHTTILSCTRSLLSVIEIQIDGGHHILIGQILVQHRNLEITSLKIRICGMKHGRYETAQCYRFHDLAIVQSGEIKLLIIRNGDIHFLLNLRLFGVVLVVLSLVCRCRFIGIIYLLLVLQYVRHNMSLLE